MRHTTAVLVLNGELRWTRALVAIAAGAGTLLAADGGANALARLGLRPDRVVGDLDSIEAATRAWVGEDRLRPTPDQDSTDFEKAVALAFGDLRLERLTVLGALGGRVDHTLANIGLAARLARGEDLVLLDHRQRVLATSSPLTLNSAPGETWSFWTFEPAVTVDLEGVRWPVTNAALHVGGRPSISNRAIGDAVVVRPTGGAVVVCREFDSGK